MIHLGDDERRRAFAAWLRTGRLPTVRGSDGIELKFNPWHDPRNGRFTFANTGQHYGRWGGGGFTGGGGGKGGGAGAGASGTWGPPTNPERRTVDNRVSKGSPPSRLMPSKRPADKSPTKPGWAGGGFTGGGGGDFGGAGATGTGDWGAPSSSSRGPAIARQRQSEDARPKSTNVVQGTVRADEQFRTVTRNGYTYKIDSCGRTRGVSGTLTLADAPSRSRAAQAKAGGIDRRRTDDGGHYIAARFNGPREAFNHFAQDASVNRGRYRALEDEWARAKRAGQSVVVKIVPVFNGVSDRPSVIDVWFTINGKRKSQKFLNEPAEKNRGK